MSPGFARKGEKTRTGSGFLVQKVHPFPDALILFGATFWINITNLVTLILRQACLLGIMFNFDRINRMHPGVQANYLKN
jgi:hypothetical protein